MAETFEELRNRTMDLVRKVIETDNHEYDYWHYGFELTKPYVWLMKSSSDGDIAVSIAHNDESFWRQLDAHLAAEIIDRALSGEARPLHADDIENGFVAFASARHTYG